MTTQRQAPRSSLPCRRDGGPVWCSRKGRNAVVSLVGTGATWGDYVQWCSLVGADVVCDERCLREGAQWPAGDVPGVSREIFCAVRDVILLVRDERAQRGYDDNASWSQWARSFVAGLCSARTAWQAAQMARCEGISGACDPAARQLALAAEDAAWAAAHAASGNIALAMHSLARARRLANLSASPSS
jgi:hypothetical protein